MLSPYRVLDLTDHRGEIGAMILADLGADVIKIEPVGGSTARHQGPFAKTGAGDVGESLQFAAFNRNKRSIALDLDLSEDRDVLMRLVAGADFVLESGTSGTEGPLGRRGIDFETLRAANPRLIHVLISPWGADGPAAGTPDSDLTIAAMGGPVALQGSPDRAPIRVSVPQVWRHTGAEAAAAALIGHRRMLTNGEAQFVDVSAQCAMTWTTMNAMDAHDVQGFDFERMGSTVQLGVAAIDPVFECADGFVVVVPNGGMIEPLLGHLIAEGFADETWLAEDWATFDMRLMMGQETRFSREQAAEAMMKYLKSRTKAELFAMGIETGLTFAPVNTVADLLSMEQLTARGQWHEIAVDDQKVRAPGAFALMNEAPIALDRPAPGVDEHGAEIRAEAQRHCADSDAEIVDLPFAGLNLLDLTWVIAGPSSVRYFSDHGATVIKVESSLRPDGLRALGPVRGEEGSPNRSHFYGEFNAGKKCVQLNLKVPEAFEILKKLIRWADVLIENWAPGATERLGIDYPRCREINPDIIMVSTSLMGQSGPAREVAGFGFHAGAMAGFYEVTGYPDRQPVGPWLAYTDVIAPRFIAAMTTAAIDHRRRTGAGQHIDAAQFEMALQFLAPEIIDAQLSGYVATRLGNRHRDYAPQGVYRCDGDDNWCAIAVETDAHWQALAAVLGDPSMPGADSTHAQREAVHDEIDAAIANWTGRQAARSVMDQLVAVGVPGGVVQRSGDLANDPQYKHRDFQRWHEHPEMGNVPYAGVQFCIPGYRPGPFGPAPLLGQHNDEVFRKVLGLSEAEVKQAEEAGAIQ
jgi:crotonobetainyl-CoA:carnitine CoA-transferase CaiB-like acyl-CoA transferase